MDFRLFCVKKKGFEYVWPFLFAINDTVGEGKAKAWLEKNNKVPLIWFEIDWY